MVELRIVKALRRANISLQAIRFAISHAKKLFGVDHPLASLQFKTDGAEILIDAVEEDGELMSLSRRRPGQKVFAKIIDQSLNDLEFENGQAVLWRPYRWKAIVIDPKRLFGAPILEDYGVSTSTLYEEFQVFQDIGYLSKIYEIPKKSIQAAIFYERTLDEVMAQAAIESTP
ncbi:hypothetical protein CFI11_06875 [Thalassococcus sp. S3]|nr:hypothetical protein CFI11_06875 [Thalassococcus sp. S3]